MLLAWLLLLLMCFDIVVVDAAGAAAAFDAGAAAAFDAGAAGMPSNTVDLQLRLCRSCNVQAYLRKEGCANPNCTLYYVFNEEWQGSKKGKHGTWKGSSSDQKDAFKSMVGQKQTAAQRRIQWYNEHGQGGRKKRKETHGSNWNHRNSRANSAPSGLTGDNRCAPNAAHAAPAAGLPGGGLPGGGLPGYK